MSHLDFQKRDDRIYLLNDRWPEHVTISCHLLEQAEPKHIREDGDEIRISVANGYAIYRVDRRDPDFDLVSTTLVGGLLNGH